MTNDETQYHEIDAIEEVMNALVDIQEKASLIEIRERARAAFHIMSAARDYSTIAKSFGDCEAGGRVGRRMKNTKRKKGVLEAAIIELNHIRKFGESYEIRGRAATAHYLIQTVIALVDNDRLGIDDHVENVARDLRAAYELLSAVYGGGQCLDSVARSHVYYARRAIEEAIEADSVNWLTGEKQ